jgi:hypothetical protein
VVRNSQNTSTNKIFGWYIYSHSIKQDNSISIKRYMKKITESFWKQRRIMIRCLFIFNPKIFGGWTELWKGWMQGQETWPWCPGFPLNCPCDLWKVTSKPTGPVFSSAKWGSGINQSNGVYKSAYTSLAYILYWLWTVLESPQTDKTLLFT